jgi:hypothetical protein
MVSCYKLATDSGYLYKTTTKRKTDICTTMLQDTQVSCTQYGLLSTEIILWVVVQSPEGSYNLIPLGTLRADCPANRMRYTSPCRSLHPDYITSWPPSSFKCLASRHKNRPRYGLYTESSTKSPTLNNYTDTRVYIYIYIYIRLVARWFKIFSVRVKYKDGYPATPCERQGREEV